jgi:hypothetical protein
VRTARLAALVLLAACQAADPDPGQVGNGGDEGEPYADAVLGWSEAGVAMSCAAEVGACGTLGTCGPTDVLGAPDEAGVAIAPGDLMEVGLLCSFVRETGATADLKLWATFEAGADLVVEVSEDGTAWFDLGAASGDDPELGLEVSELAIARYVRMTNRGTGTVTLDAVEALR